jgi:hypothetical protein
MAFRFRSIALAALALAGLALPAAAQTPLDRHQAYQAQTERHGIRTGQITPREAHRIDMARRDLAQHEAVARRDGYVSPRERQELRQHARQVDRMIHRQMADGQRW